MQLDINQSAKCLYLCRKLTVVDGRICFCRTAVCYGRMAGVFSESDLIL